MNDNKSRSAEQIFNDMHSELRSWNRDIPESPDRMDPVLRIMMQLYAGQLHSIDRKIEQTWEKASNSLIKSLCPESMRWPVPAFTVVRTEPTDPVVIVDPQTRFFYREERENGQTFFFSTLRNERMIASSMKHIYFVTNGQLHDLSPRPPESTQVSSRMHSSALNGSDSHIYLALHHDGKGIDFEKGTIFLQGKPDALKQLQWSRWYPYNGESFDDSAGFCPGLIGSIDDMFKIRGRMIDWGGLRKSSDLFKPLENHFINIPTEFSSAWKPGAVTGDLKLLLEKGGIAVPTDIDNIFWIRIDLPSGGDKNVFQSAFEVYTDCLVVVNKNELTLFKHTGGNRLIEIDLPEPIDHILEVISVTDSNGHNYIPRHEALTNPDQKFYTVEEINGHLTLWFDFSTGIELPPDSLMVNYAVTAGTEANGISAGKITELYEHHPGLKTIRNILPVRGAIPAKSEEQIINEVASRLRGRDRALSFSEITEWTKTFDSRIIRADCAKGVQRTAHGVRKCIVVTVTVQGDAFYSDDEIGLLKSRLESFLKARSSVNAQFKLEIRKK